MHLELECVACCKTTRHDLTDEHIAPFDALGDGATLEDNIYVALETNGMSHCSDCGERMPISASKIGRLAQGFLLCL